MKKIILVVVLVMMMGSSGFANPLQFMWGQDDQWLWQDTLIQGIFTSLMLIDWRQTHDVITEKETVYQSGDVVDQNGTVIGSWHYKYERYKYNEKNPILGEHPSKKKLAFYMSSMIIGHNLIAYILPRPYREIWQAAGIGIEITSIANNYSAGVRITSKF